MSYSAADSTEACWLTYRLLWAIPWPADAVPASAAAARTMGAIFDETVLSRHTSRPSLTRGCRGRQSGRKSLAHYGANSYGATQTHPTPPQMHLPRAPGRQQSSQTALHSPPKQIPSSRHPRALAAWTSRAPHMRPPGGAGAGAGQTRRLPSPSTALHPTRALPEMRKPRQPDRDAPKKPRSRLGMPFLAEGHRLGGPEPQRVTAYA